MKVHVVTSLREFDSLAPSWAEVLRDGNGGGSPFLSHDWFASCWRTAGPHRRREVMVMEDSAGPLAFVPLMRCTARVGHLPARTLRVLDAPGAPLTDLPIAGDPNQVISTLISALCARRDWDVLSFDRIPADSSTLKALKAALGWRLSWRETDRHALPYLSVSGTWPQFLCQQSRRFKKTLRNVEHRLRRAGEITVEEHREVDPQAQVFAEAMDIWLHYWNSAPGALATSAERASRFVCEFTPRASANGWLRLWVLRLDGRAIAAEYQVGAQGRLHALLGGFDAALANLSPGSYLRRSIVSSLFETGGIREYYLGARASASLSGWASGILETSSIEVFAPTAYGRFLHAVDTRLVPLARRWLFRGVGA